MMTTTMKQCTDPTTNQTIYIGSIVQVLDASGCEFAALVVDLEPDGRLNLRVFPSNGADSLTICGVRPLGGDSTDQQWRALPKPTVMAEFPVTDFVQALEPLVTAAAQVAVEEALNAKSSPS